MFGVLAARLSGVFDRLACRGVLDEAALKDALREMRVALLEADVNLSVARAFLARVDKEARTTRLPRGSSPGDQVLRLVHKELIRLLGSDQPPPFPKETPTAVMLVGLHGCGKSTTCAKLCHLLARTGKTPVLLAADTRRAAAPEQLSELGAAVGVEVIVLPGVDPVAVAVRGAELLTKDPQCVVVVDTAGRLHIDGAPMAELEAMEDALRPSDTFLVADAMTGQDAVRIAQEFRNRLHLTGVILTKMDGDARGGAALSMREVTGTPVRFVGVGERPTDLELFRPERVAGRILGMGDLTGLAEKAYEAVGEDDVARMQEAVRKGTLDLEDLLTHMRQLGKPGPLGNILRLLPGAEGMSVASGSSEFARAEAIICSMTLQERRKPAMIDGSRRQRIAKGSGTSVHEVNQLLRQFELVRGIARGTRSKSVASLLSKTGR